MGLVNTNTNNVIGTVSSGKLNLSKLITYHFFLNYEILKAYEVLETQQKKSDEGVLLKLKLIMHN
jgi:hypothetical protein